MNLKQRILKLLDVYYPEETKDSEIERDLSRRGKIDQRKIIEILFLIVKEVDEMAEKPIEITSEPMKPVVKSKSKSKK